VIMQKNPNLLLFIMHTTSIDVFLFNNITVAFNQQLSFERKIKLRYVNDFYSNITVFILVRLFLRYNVNNLTLVVKHLLERISTT
jgi:hypothetical protein